MSISNSFLEQTIHGLNVRVKSIRGQLDSSQAHAKDLRTKLTECQAAKENVERDLASLKLSSASTTEEVASLNSKVQSLVSEKMQLLERIDNKNNETKDLQNELEASRKANVVARKSVIELESQVQQYRSAQISTKLREQNLAQEITLLKKSNEWLNKELLQKSTDLSQFRSEKLSLIANLQTDLSLVQSQHHTLEQSHERLKERYNETTRKLDDTLIRVKDLQDSQTATEEGFRVEMASQKRLVELWERSANEAKDRVQDLESQAENERLQSIEEVSHWRNEAEKEKAKSAKLERQLSNLEAQLEPSFFGGDVSTSTPFSPMGSPNKSGVFSPSAQIITEIQKGGGSLVQLYSDFKETKTRLEREKFKNKTLRDQMTSILEEMESQAPAILAEREENVRLESELTELSIRLETVTSNCEELQNKLKTSEIKTQDNIRENKLLSKQVNDLSRQIQHLLIQNQLNSDTSSPLLPDEHSALQRLLKGEDPTESDTDKLISQRLVLFSNTIELQRQNENLLKITRQLGAKMEKEEAATRQKMEDVESSVVSEAKEAIETLQAEIEESNTKLTALTRERDMFRRMLSNKTENGVTLDKLADASPEGVANLHTQQLIKHNEELIQNVKKTQAQFDAYKTETSAALAKAEDKIASLSTERSTLQIQLAKTDSQLELANERFNNLESNFKSLRDENEDVKKRAHTLQESLFRQEIRAKQVSEEVSSVNSLLESLRNEAAHLKAEKSLWKSIEERLNKENSDLIEERGRLSGLLANAQTIEAERIASAAETQQRLSTQVSDYQNELSVLRTKLDSEHQEVRSLSQLKETQAKEYQERIDKLSSELHTTREALLQSRDERHQIELKSHELQLELKTAQENLSIFRADSEGNATVEEITALRNSLALANNELELNKQHMDELKNVSTNAEDALQNMIQSYDNYKKEIDETIAGKDVEISNLKEQLSVTSKISNAVQAELASLKEQESNKISKYVAEEKRLQGLVTALQSNEARLQESVQQMKDDFMRQASIAADAQQNYEREVVKHADATNALQALRAEHSLLKEQIFDLTATVTRTSEQLASSQSSWESQKYTYEDEIDQLKSRTDSLSSQNKVLLDQLEGISAQLANRSSNPPTYDEATTTSEEQLREIISYIRKEKEILDVKYELNSQDLKRLQQKLDHTVAALDQTKLELEKEREKDGDKLRLSQEHEKVMAQLNDINILRESNATLRQQSQFYSQKAKELEAEIEKQKATYEPLEGQLRDALAEVEMKEQQIKLTQQDGNRWKERAQQILQKYEVSFFFSFILIILTNSSSVLIRRNLRP